MAKLLQWGGGHQWEMCLLAQSLGERSSKGRNAASAGMGLRKSQH